MLAVSPSTRKQSASFVGSVASTASTDAKQLMAQFRRLLATDSKLIEKILEASAAGSWPQVESLMRQLVRQPEYQELLQLCNDLGFETQGFVGGAKVSLIVSADGLAGPLTDTPRALAFYSYESIGLSLGLSEGGEGVIGLFVATERPINVAGSELFTTLQADLGVGAGAELITSPSGSSWGMVLFVSSGEEIDVSAGAGYAWVEKIS